MSVQLKNIYAEVAAFYDKEAQDQIANVWVGVLGRFTPSQIKAAIAEHQADSSVDDYTGRTRGSFMPDASRLKAIIERIGARQVINGRPKCGGPDCSDGWLYVNDSGLVLPKNLPIKELAGKRVKRCPDCLELRRRAVGA